MARYWKLAGAAALFVVFTLTVPQAASATTEWTVVPTPHASDVSYSVSCTTSDACVSVGSLTSIRGSTRTLAERFSAATGREWRVVHTPVPSAAKSSALLGISCTAANACIAVGTYTSSGGLGMTLAEGWDGKSWSIVATPDPTGATGARLSQVSCTAANACTAVGSYTREGSTATLIERWNGTEWSIQESPNPSESTNARLQGVACASSSACTAVGYYLTSAGSNALLAESWNGTTWSLQAVPSPVGSTGAQLRSVSCTAASACTAVGAYKTVGATLTLAERWNGTEWHVQTTPNSGTANNALSGVSCKAANACTAVGGTSGGTLAEHWNGSEWVIQETPTSAPGSTLSGISCSSTTTCNAAGDDGEGGSLQESSSGSSWSIGETKHATDDSEDVSCTSASACTAVGSYYPLELSGSRILAARWNGSDWSAQRAPNPPETTAVFFAGVSCTAVDSCTAVGSYTTTTSPGTLPLAEHWNGSEWSIQATPTLSGVRNVGFGGVSCSAAAACTAVGTVEGPEDSTTFVERWNGTEWAIQESPNPVESPNAQLYAVSCSASNSCVAVGYYFTNSSFDVNLPLVEHWNGTTWSLQTAPLPTSGEDGALFGVSCSAASICTAVGQYARSGSDNETLAERWNGTEWSAQPTPNAGSFGDNLAGVSCRASNACSAVGSSGSSVLAAGWNGTEWLIQSTPPEATGDLRGVSCTAATFCMAAGADDQGGSLDEIYTG